MKFFISLSRKPMLIAVMLQTFIGHQGVDRKNPSADSVFCNEISSAAEVEAEEGNRRGRVKLIDTDCHN